MTNGLHLFGVSPFMRGALTGALRTAVLPVSAATLRPNLWSPFLLLLILRQAESIACAKYDNPVPRCFANGRLRRLWRSHLFSNRFRSRMPACRGWSRR